MGVGGGGGTGTCNAHPYIYIISGSKQIFICRVGYIRRHIVHNRDIHDHIDM